MKHTDIIRKIIAILLEKEYTFEATNPLQVYEYYLLGDEKRKDMRFRFLVLSHSAAKNIFGKEWKSFLSQLIIADDFYEYLSTYLIARSHGN